MADLVVGFEAGVADARGKQACVRSGAWQCDFSSQHRTRAFQAGLR